jgi:PAS domain S-box-containing protein
MDAGCPELARMLLANCLDGMAAFDPECCYVSWSPAMERISGMAEGEVLGRCAFDVFPFMKDTGEDQHYRRALAGERIGPVERPFYVPASGRLGVVEAYYAPLESSRGEIVGGSVIVRDVTERRMVEAQAAETEGRFRIMADVAPTMLWMSRAPDGLCTFFNQTWLDFTGRTLEDEWGVGWAEGIHPEDFQQCLDGYYQAFSQRRAFELEYRLRRHDGEYRWILDRGVPRYLSDGTFAGYIGSCADITERKQTEEELENAVRARDEFLQIVSHELKTPLTPLQLRLEMMARALEKAGMQGDPLFEKLEAAGRQATRLNGLVESLLEVSRIRAGRLTLELEEFDLCEVVRAVAGRFGAEARKNATDLVVRTDPAIVGTWDRLRIEQVVAKLLSNAIKFGAGKPVEMEVRESGGAALLAATDHGIGIEREALERIFGPFERAVSVRHFGGLGLGLFIARRIAEAHGGTISAHSRPGEGSTFTVLLPRWTRRSAPGEPCVEGRWASVTPRP